MSRAKKKKPKLVEALIEEINVGDEVRGIRYPELVRAARKAKGLRLQDVADKVGCSVGFLSRFERGDKFPTPYLFEKIQQVLQIGPYDQFLNVPIDADEEESRARHEEGALLRKLPKMRMLFSVLLSALREKGYDAQAHMIRGQGESVDICIEIGDAGGGRFALRINEIE